ncbi:hypothetical protein SUGI_1142620 [Cryptomeria japonica]|uniref:bZIP transcription factor 53-like n=1 Tax=Cryptomeria japonica TaxID=3369 RepID=UPI002414762A|nr:bZIP transcription factor 53-like [Cryptomeria japonica]GLJ53566.1 hypothetical protein SUGI_1142620 [Cryptomeria japonica]
MAPPSNAILPNSNMGMSACTNSTISSGGPMVQQVNSGSEEDPHQIIDERKQKRMISNREYARRSRLRKQQHLDELRKEAFPLREENNRSLTDFNFISRNYKKLHEENIVLKTHADELTLKMQYLNMAMQWAGVLNGLDLSSSNGLLDPIPMDNNK